MGGFAGAGVCPQLPSTLQVPAPQCRVSRGSFSWSIAPLWPLVGEGVSRSGVRARHVQLRAHVCTHVCTHARTHTHRYTPGNEARVCVCVHARYTPPCAHMHQDAHTWEDVHTGHAQADVETGPVTCEDGAGHLQALRDTAATTKGGGAPSRTRGAGAQRSETGRTAGNPTWGGPHTGRGCLTSPGPTRSAPAPTLGPRTEFCASGSLFLGNETFPKGIVVP